MEDVRAILVPMRTTDAPGCERCAGRICERLSSVPGVRAASLDSAGAALRVEFDQNAVTAEFLQDEVRRIGSELARRIDHATFDLRGLDCPDCAAAIDRSIARLPGVIWSATSFPTARVSIEFERGHTQTGEVLRVLAAHGACPLTDRPSAAGARTDSAAGRRRLDAWWAERRRLGSTLAAVALLALGIAFRFAGGGLPETLALAAAIVVGGHGIARAALVSARQRVMDMNALMTLAVLGAAAIGDWLEGATVVALYGIGNLLQAGAVERTRSAIDALVASAPRTARVLREQIEVAVPISEVQPGDEVLVRPGEQIPVDGIVLDGASEVSQASITGESVPVARHKGGEVYAGTLNGSGALRIRVTRASADTLFSRIVRRVREAQAQRAPIQGTIDRFARRYTPAVVTLAVGVALVPPAMMTLTGAAPAGTTAAGIWLPWVLRGLALLLISCPCALVISTPVAIVTAIGQAARRGVLVKGGAYLEQAGRTRAILWDKTGTLTTGRFRIDEVTPLGSLSCQQVLSIAAAIEQQSEHPIAAAFSAADPAHPNLAETVSDYRSVPGLGARARLRGTTFALGSPALMQNLGVPLDAARERLQYAEASGKTVVLLADDQHLLGLILLSDRPRPNAADAVHALADLGIEHQVMLTGDSPTVAASVAREAGLDDYRASLLPEQKLAVVHEYRARYGAVAMVGDGINDAPALAASTVGIAMGAAASDTAIETADIALLGADPAHIPYLIRLSRRTHAIVAQNIAIALGVKGLLICAALAVQLPLWLAVAGDVGVSLLVTANALRLRAPIDGTLPRFARHTS